MTATTTNADTAAGRESAGLANRAAVAGIGATEFSKDSGRSELRLACEAVRTAIDDAGLEPSEVDGLVTFTADTNSEIHLARNTGMGAIRHFSRVHYGGGAACGTVAQAAMAVATGAADVVVCYRAFNERSGVRYGLGQADRALSDDADRAAYSWMTPFGLATPAQWVAMFARRYMHEYGATSEDFGRVSVTMRRHAATNPAAWFHRRPITLAEHQASRWIAEPLHLLDCCQETDGGQALVVVSADRAKDLPHPPAYIAGAAQGSGPDQHMMTSYYRPSISGIPEMGLVGSQLYAQSGLRPDDIAAAILYDHFTPLLLPQLEELGFCARGEAKDFVRAGHLELDGRLPCNTHGGQLGEAYLHGMNGIAEGVRLIRGASVNQPGAVPHVLVTAGTGVPTSGLILARDR
ncbi:lipid-transfer protein [Saccharomonospora halophila]|uniref:lipid-transfer protein n=1 Tax=Saccharomonospora halophila TaxID=129922 RepID=UPI000363B3AA|nr:lipid-transfer protein [Saccharomonospora halophila]